MALRIMTTCVLSATEHPEKSAATLTRVCDRNRQISPKLQEWSSAELFWIIKNGIKMTGMPAFGPTHQDEQIWNIVGFVRVASTVNPRIQSNGAAGRQIPRARARSPSPVEVALGEAFAASSN